MVQLHDKHERIRVLRRAFGQVKQFADGLNVACACPNPRCTSTLKKKLKLAIKLDDGQYHCWVCNIKGKTIAHLISRRVPSLRDVALKMWPPQLKQLKIIEQDNIACADVDDAQVELPDGFVLLAEHVDSRVGIIREVVDYVVSRGITRDEMWRLRLGISLSSGFLGRVVIPSFDSRGAVNFYTTRAIRDSIWPKYKNARVPKHRVIFNEIDVDWGRQLLLTEGPLDLAHVRCNATCLLGSSLDEHHALFSKIVANNTPVVLALDGDARAKMHKIAELFYNYDIDVRFVTLGRYNDLGEMSPEAIDECVRYAKRWTPTFRLRDRIALMRA